jgi:hypothetical protein
LEVLVDEKAGPNRPIGKSSDAGKLSAGSGLPSATAAMRSENSKNVCVKTRWPWSIFTMRWS